MTGLKEAFVKDTMSRKATISEDLFEEFCSWNNIPLARVPETTEKTPDYRMSLSATDVVVEVKELSLTQEEKEIVECDPELFDAAWDYHWGIPGEKLRKKITSAVPQLKALSLAAIPSLLVVHDPVRFWPELLDADAVRAAMYGIETILISSEPAPEGGATILRRWHGGRKKLTKTHNTSLSAIGILLRENNRLKLDVFHNWYAAAPLSPAVFSGSGITHYRLRSEPLGCFPEWSAYEDALEDPDRP